MLFKIILNYNSLLVGEVERNFLRGRVGCFEVEL